jgi:hypothetical protein
MSDPNPNPNSDSDSDSNPRPDTAHDQARDQADLSSEPETSPASGPGPGPERTPDSGSNPASGSGPGSDPSSGPGPGPERESASDVRSASGGDQRDDPPQSDGPPQSLEDAASDRQRRQDRAHQLRGNTAPEEDRGQGTSTNERHNERHDESQNDSERGGSSSVTVEYNDLSDEEVLQQVYEDANRTKPYKFPTKYREIDAQIGKVEQEQAFDFLRELLAFQSERDQQQSSDGDSVALSDLNPEDVIAEDGSFSLDELDDETRADIADAAANAGPADIPSGRFVGACKEMLAEGITASDESKTNMFRYLIRETSEVPVREIVDGAIRVFEFTTEADFDESFR